MLDHLVDIFKKSDSIDLTGDKLALQRLREASEKAKIELSSAQRRPRDVAIRVTATPIVLSDSKSRRSVDSDVARANTSAVHYVVRQSSAELESEKLIRHRPLESFHLRLQ